MFKISWELAISSLVLISAILCIWSILKKITTIVIPTDFSLNSDPFRDSKKTESNLQTDQEKNQSKSKNLINGIDGSIFEKFKNNLNLGNSKNNPSEISFSKENIEKDDFVQKIYENAESFNDQKDFSKELNEKEQVRVTLSESAKNLNKFGTNTLKDSDNSSFELDEASNGRKNYPSDTLGSGEEALKILSSKQEALRKQNKKSPIIDLVDYDNDLFEDELIPIPGGENFVETDEESSKNNKKNKNHENSNFLEDEKSLEDSITNNLTVNEKISEAESLLNLATTACETGKIEEAKASLKIYLDLLKEVNQEPSINVKELAIKLNLTIESNQSNQKNDQNDDVNSDAPLKEEQLLQDLPEQANYANVMDGLVKSLEKKESYEEALPLLMDLLEYNRKRGNISDMDSLYDRIEQAYSTMKNDEKLVSAYKEHLSIKQKLNDLEGELNLLDLISYYYANTGDQNASERYQDESQRVKKIIEKKITSERKN